MKETSPSMDVAAFALGLPKAELHVHLEGTIEPEMKLLLAERNGIEIEESTAEEIRETYTFSDLSGFLVVYFEGLRVMRTSQDFYDVAWAYFFRAAEQGTRHIELFFSPQAHTSRGIPFSDVIMGTRRAILRAQAELDVSVSLIMSILRDRDESWAMSTLMEALPFKPLIQGIGMGSNEHRNPPEKFTRVFRRARQEGFMLTVHCDIDQVNSIEHIRQAIQDIEVDRIDHGTNVIESDELVAEVIRRGIALTCCPISNSFVTSEMKAEEISCLMRRGVLVTINSDDPGYHGGYIGDNYAVLAARFGFTASDLVRLAENSFLASWLTSWRQDSYLSELWQYAAAHDVCLSS